MRSTTRDCCGVGWTRGLFFCVLAGIVCGEDVVAEVARKVAPDRVDVVGLVLGVVEFDHEGFALNAIIMARAAVEDAGPSEVEAVEIFTGRFGEGGIGDLGAVACEIQLQQGAELVALGGGERGGGESGGSEGINPSFVAGGDVVRGFDGDEGGGTLRGVEAVYEGEAEVFFFGEDAGAFLRAGANLGGVGAEKRWRHGDVVGVKNRKVEREMVAFEAPTPRRRGRWVAEDRYVVHRGIAADGVFFDFAEDVFEGDNGLGAGSAALAKAGAEQGAREVLLRGRHVFEGETIALDGDEEPFFAFGRGETEDGAGALRGIERSEEFLGRAGHLGGRGERGEGRGPKQGGDDGKDTAWGEAHGRIFCETDLAGKG